jgi:hypothetical protein
MFQQTAYLHVQSEQQHIRGNISTGRILHPSDHGFSAHFASTHIMQPTYCQNFGKISFSYTSNTNMA